MENATSSSARRGYQITCTLIVLVALGLCFVSLGDTVAVRPDDESYHMGIAAEMYARGDWWVPTWFGRPALNKPPLTYWLFFAGFAVQGVSFAAARVPMVLLTLATALVTFQCARLLYGSRAGLVAGLLTITSFGMLAMGRIGMTDMPLCFLISVAVWALAEALVSGRPWWWAVLFAAAGASTLAKGPFSLIVIALIVTWVLMTVRPRNLAALRHPLALAGLIAGAAAVVSWPLALWRHDLFRQWYEFFVLRENFGKFGDLYYPPWVLLEYLFLYTLPWSPLVIAAAWIQIRHRQRRDLGVSLPLAWLFGVLLFHTIPATKLAHYVLPAVPACAILVAAAHERLMASTAGRIGRIGVQVIFGAVAIALLAVLRLTPGNLDRVLLASAACALAAAIWMLARPSTRFARSGQAHSTRDAGEGQGNLIAAGIASGIAFTLVLAVLPHLAFPRLPDAALPHLRGHEVVLIRQQTYVFSYDIGQVTREINTRADYEDALKRDARAIVFDTDLAELLRDGADARAFVEVFSWPQWKRTLAPAALVSAAWQGSRDGLIERVRIVKPAAPPPPTASPALP